MIYFTLIMTSETFEIDLSKVHGLVLKARKPAKAGILEEKGEKVSDFLIY